MAQQHDRHGHDGHPVVAPAVTSAVAKQPTAFQKLQIFLLNHAPVPWYKIGLLPGLVALVVRRTLLQSLNLLATPVVVAAATAPGGAGGDSPLPDHRTPDGAGNTPGVPSAGAYGTPFGRNMPRAPPDLPDGNDGPRRPHVQKVAQALLARRRFATADGQFNVLAATWIQAMVHDWMNHFVVDDNDEESSPSPAGGFVELDRGAEAGCPLASFRFRKTRTRPNDDFFDNARTHWWDASFVYGQTPKAVSAIRTFQGGHIHVSSASNRYGDIENTWAGITLLQKLFQNEHNAVADHVSKEHPEIAHDDEKLFNISRLVVAAVVAKIHTIDWTVELLKTKLLDVGMHTNWVGIAQALKLPASFSKPNPPNLLGLVGKPRPEDHGVPYCLTEEFVAVYRMHPMMPDWMPVGANRVAMEHLLGETGDNFVAIPEKASQLWDSLVKYPCGSLTLFNYPSFLRSVTPTGKDGVPSLDKVDLAALDLYRDRERGILPFNEFRRKLNLNPYRDWRHLTGGNEEMMKALSEIYGADGIERCDLLVGNLAEAKIPGFAISETAFVIFIVMASRRLEADRFFTTDFNEATYTKAGFQWVNSTGSLRDVIMRHVPGMPIPSNASAFTPLGKWPEETM
jgi:alpha-dioxygenase